MEQEEHEVTEEQDTMDFSKPDFVFVPNGHHSYRQHGPYLICRSCEVQHAVYVGMEKIMVGENEKGEPILKKRKDL